MECTLATLIACFSWSGLYLETGLAYREDVEHFTLIEHSALMTDQGELILEDSITRPSSAKRRMYGHLGIGYEMRFEHATLCFEALSHDSRLETNKDRGENSYRINLRVFPFR